MLDFLKPWHVTVYLIDRRYGGPEEGGWYYTAGEPQDHPLNRRFFLKKNALCYLRSVKDQVIDLNDDRPPLYSVMSEGVYRAFLDEGKPHPFPSKQPHYE